MEIKDKVAIIYAAGSITSGIRTKDNMGSVTIAAAIKKARKDKLSFVFSSQLICQ